ncbi:hypothetical protein D3C84_1052000 [compost metagenome]
MKITIDAVLFQHLRNDLRDGQLLKNTLIDAMNQISHPRNECHAVTSQTLTGIAFGNAMYLTVNAVASAEGKKRLFMQQAFSINVRPLADQNHFEGIGCADRFLAFEL